MHFARLHIAGLGAPLATRHVRLRSSTAKPQNLNVIRQLRGFASRSLGTLLCDKVPQNAPPEHRFSPCGRKPLARRKQARNSQNQPELLKGWFCSDSGRLKNNHISLASLAQGAPWETKGMLGQKQSNEMFLSSNVVFLVAVNKLPLARLANLRGRRFARDARSEEPE